MSLINKVKHLLKEKEGNDSRFNPMRDEEIPFFYRVHQYISKVQDPKPLNPSIAKVGAETVNNSDYYNSLMKELIYPELKAYSIKELMRCNYQGFALPYTKEGTMFNDEFSLIPYDWNSGVEHINFNELLKICELNINPFRVFIKTYKIVYDDYTKKVCILNNKEDKRQEKSIIAFRQPHYYEGSYCEEWIEKALCIPIPKKVLDYAGMKDQFLNDFSDERWQEWNPERQ